MKSLFTAIAIILILISCNENETFETSYIISGKDTFVVTGYFNINTEKANGSSGHNDTLNNIWTYKFTNSFKKDTVFIHDTVYTSKNYGNVTGDIYIGN